MKNYQLKNVKEKRNGAHVRSRQRKCVWFF